MADKGESPVTREEFDALKLSVYALKYKVNDLLAATIEKCSQKAGRNEARIISNKALIARDREDIDELYSITRPLTNYVEVLHKVVKANVEANNINASEKEMRELTAWFDALSIDDEE